MSKATAARALPAALPWDIFSQVAQFLYCSADPSFFRSVSYDAPRAHLFSYRIPAGPHSLRLVCRQSKEESNKLLHKITISDSAGSRVVDFAGAAPSVVEVADWPTEDSIISTLCGFVAGASELILSAPGSAPVVPALESVLRKVSVLNITPNSHSDAKTIAPWVKAAQQLTHLDVSGPIATVKPLIAAATFNCSKLQFVRIDHDSHVAAPLMIHLKPLLPKVSSTLKALVLPASCEDILALLPSVTRGDKPQFIQSMKEFAAKFPREMVGLGNVYVRVQEPATMDVPLLGFLYAYALTEDIATILLKKIEAAGVNAKCDEYGDTALTYLLSVPSGPTRMVPGTVEGSQQRMSVLAKFSRLFQIGADAFARASIPSFIEEIRFPTFGNAFHIAALFSDATVSSGFLDSVDLSNINSIECFQSIEGFTPLHIASRDEDTWIALHEALTDKFPKIMEHRDNVHGTSPVEAIFSRNDRNFVQAGCVARIFNHLLETEEDELRAQIKSSRALFGMALDFFGSLMNIPRLRAKDSLGGAVSHGAGGNREDGTGSENEAEDKSDGVKDDAECLKDGKKTAKLAKEGPSSEDDEGEEDEVDGDEDGDENDDGDEQEGDDDDGEVNHEDEEASVSDEDELDAEQISELLRTLFEAQPAPEFSQAHPLIEGHRIVAFQLYVGSEDFRAFARAGKFSQESISVAYSLVVASKSCNEIREQAMEDLLALGADRNYHVPFLFDGLPPLFAFAASSCPKREDASEYYYFQSDVQSFWSNFWDMVEHGAKVVLPGDGAPSLVASARGNIVSEYAHPENDIGRLGSLFLAHSAQFELAQLGWKVLSALSDVCEAADEKTLISSLNGLSKIVEEKYPLLAEAWTEALLKRDS